MSLDTKKAQIIESKILSNSSTFKITFQVDIDKIKCRNVIKDIAVYYEKCQSFCNSNICPDTLPYYKHPTLDQCVSDCSPFGMYGEILTNSCVTQCSLGRTPSGSICVDYAFCSSTCATCLQKIYVNTCTSCPVSDFMRYVPFSGGKT